MAKGTRPENPPVPRSAGAATSAKSSAFPALVLFVAVLWVGAPLRLGLVLGLVLVVRVLILGVLVAGILVQTGGRPIFPQFPAARCSALGAARSRPGSPLLLLDILSGRLRHSRLDPNRLIDGNRV